MANYAPVKASTSVPSLYRLVLTTLEPLAATGGVLQTLTNPESYLQIMTRSRVPYDPATHFLYTELAGSWLLFVFLVAFALRHFDDLRVWRWVCLAVLLQDALYMWSVAEAVGGWAVWVDVKGWQVSDWLVLWTTLPGFLVRVLIVLGIGVNEERRGVGPKRG